MTVEVAGAEVVAVVVAGAVVVVITAVVLTVVHANKSPFFRMYR